MPQISDSKKEKISEHILSTLISNSPKPLFTAEIAREIARDEEFVKKILLDLNKKGVIVKVDKSPKGVQYSRKTRWRLSNQTYNFYKSNNTI